MNLTDIIIYAIPCWVINMSLNGLYVLKTAFPSFKRYDVPLSARLLGTSTTLPGIGVAIIVGIILSKIMRFPLSTGLLYGLCVYFGHALGSFIKRRLGYKDGAYMPVADHGDYIFLTGTVFVLLGLVNWKVALLALLLTLAVHPIVSYLSYLVKLKKYPW